MLYMCGTGCVVLLSTRNFRDHCRNLIMCRNIMEEISKMATGDAFRTDNDMRSNLWKELMALPDNLFDTNLEENDRGAESKVGIESKES